MFFSDRRYTRSVPRGLLKCSTPDFNSLLGNLTGNDRTPFGGTVTILFTVKRRTAGGYPILCVKLVKNAPPSTRTNMIVILRKQYCI